MSALVERNAPWMHAIADAFLVVQEVSWPNEAVDRALRSPTFAAQRGANVVHTFIDAIEAFCLEYPAVRVFWKDCDLAFLGVCATLAQEARLPDVEAIVGLFDDDKKLPWSRQAAKYQSDDRRVMGSGQPLLEVLERQDSGPESTRWLRTNKAPIVYEGRTVGLMGAFEVISTQQAMALASKLGHTLGGSSNPPQR
jgi:hypothetical protein